MRALKRSFPISVDQNGLQSETRASPSDHVLVLRADNPPRLPHCDLGISRQKSIPSTSTVITSKIDGERRGRFFSPHRCEFVAIELAIPHPAPAARPPLPHGAFSLQTVDRISQNLGHHSLTRKPPRSCGASQRTKLHCCFSAAHATKRLCDQASP